MVGLGLVGLGLALLCTVNAESECFEDPSQIQGKWFVTAVGSTCEHFLKHKDKGKMLVSEIAVTGENKFKLISNFPKHREEGCKRIEMEFEKQDDGTYHHKSDWGEKKLDIVSTDCETYALFVVKIQKKGKSSTLVAMYTKEPYLPDELKEMFLERGRSLALRDKQMIFPTEVACQNEA